MNKKRRIELLKILGKLQCKKCGYKKDIRALEIDHVKGGGSKEFRKFKSTVARIKYYLKNPKLAKKRLQILCCNCNRIKMFVNDEFSKQTVETLSS